MTLSADTEPIELEWLEVGSGQPTTPGGPRPTTFERRPPGAILVNRGLFRWEHAGGPPMRGTDLAIRRVLFVPFTVAAPLLATVLAELTTLTTDRYEPPHQSRVEVRRGRLVIDRRPTPAVGEHDEVRRAGQVRVQHAVHAIAIELVLAPWSACQSELRLQVRGHRTPIRLPRRYYDVAHPALATVRDLIELRPTRPPP